MWHLYIVECADKTLYTGVCIDVEKRIDEHNNSKLGAKYTRVRRPVRVVFSCECEDRSDACRKEAAVKKLSRAEKLEVVESGILEKF
ncbi:GIY-YIG nuclease family protein [Candidatus Gracilibacteria bacterium]|nr:GIY-YIG nuclease family protein [Candidatus Gracilibacteria bacterium]